MTGPGTGAASPSSHLSPHPELDRALHALAGEAAAYVREQAAGLTSTSPLLLVLGSAASGEATGVELGHRLLPLSDLDLGLFLEHGVTPDASRRVRQGLAERLHPVVERFGLTDDPVDLGIYDLGFVRRMPPTLELCEAGRAPRALIGDPAPLQALGAEPPRPFEALRLALNRLAEGFADAAPGGPAASAGGTWATDAGGTAWPDEPDASAWRAAHRAAKLPTDLLKALLAARGTLVPALSQRLTLVGAALEQARLLDQALEGWGGSTPSDLLSAWIRWRLQPVWPPPPLPLGAVAHLARAVLGEVSAQLGAAPAESRRPGTWRRLLAAEDGPARERWRRWQRMVRCRPAGISASEAWGCAMRWAPRGAWPASLAVLAFGLAWLGARAGAPPRDSERALSRERAMVHWARFARA